MIAKEISLALLSIAALPDNHGYEVVIISHNDKDCYKRVVRETKDAICLGITSMTGSQIADGLKMSKLVKSENPGVPIVWGGWHPSLCPIQTAENKYVDIVVIGQGQRTFYELITHFENKKDLSSINGIAYKKDRKISMTRPREFESLDNFPPLPYHLIDIEKYMINSEYGTRYVSYVTSQGCPFNCAFCCETTVYGRKWKCLSAERVIEDIENLVKKYKIDAISIADDNFFVDENRVKKICQGIIDRKLNIKWGEVDGRTRQLMQFSEDTWKLMKESGLYSILVGAEGPEETLRYVNKQASLQDTFDLAWRCKKYGVKVWFSCIFGLPPKDGVRKKDYKKYYNEEFNRFFDLFDELIKISKENIIAFNIYTPYPGNPMYEQAKKMGFKEPKSLEAWSKFMLYNVNTPWLSKKYSKIANQVNFLYFPFMTDTLSKVYKKSWWFRPFNSVMRLIILFRWRKRFFAFPVEFYSLKFVLWTKLKIKNLSGK